MSRDMETVYQSKVTEKLQKLDESKQNVKDFLFGIYSKDLFRILGIENSETYRLNIQQEEERLQLKREEFERAKREWEEGLTKTGFSDQMGSLT